jgi:putative ABC transport system substrate-binding protein
MNFPEWRRREVLTLLGSTAVASPIAAYAQRPQPPVIGFVNAASAASYAQPLSAFRKGLREAGYVEGRNVAIEYRWAEGRYERLPELVTDLVGRNVTLIAATSTPAAIAAKAATKTIPIVFTTSGDPVQLGLVASLSRPEGNLTGTSQLNVEVAPKRLELMHEMIPAATSIAVLINPTNRLAQPLLRGLHAAADALRLKLNVLTASSEQDFTRVFADMGELRAEALVIGTDVFFNTRSAELAALAVRYRVPAIYQYPEFTAAGGLMSYGGNLAESYRLAGVVAGRLLKGEKPADLPVQQVTKVELILNLKAAKALGLTAPLSLLGRADEVIE